MPEEARSPLAQYRVLDLTDESGDFCTKVLAALGADVIRVEKPGGDPTRRLGPFYHDEVDREKSLHWFTYNLNKRGITLNIECASGQALFKRLAATADFLVECLKPGYLESLGLGYPALSKINPCLIHTTITPFGAGGPRGGFKGSNLVCTAASGFMYMCGDEDRPPVQITTPAAYIEASLHAAAATMVAHWWRRRSGKGQHVDVSAQESVMAQSLPNFLLWRSHQLIPTRTPWGVSVPGRARASSIFKCKDGIVLSGTTISRGRKPLRDWLAEEGLGAELFDKSWDPVFEEGRAVTRAQRDRIDALFQELASRYTAEDFMNKAQAKKIQVGKINTVRDVLEDKHLKEEYFVKIEHPELGESITYPGAPFKSGTIAWKYARRAPRIGEHNREIYVDELGISPLELAALKEGGVI